MTTQASIFLLMKILRRYPVNTYLSIREICIKFNEYPQMVLQTINLGCELEYLEMGEYCKIINTTYKLGVCNSYACYGNCHYNMHCIYVHGPEEHDLLLELTGYKCSSCAILNNRIANLTKQYDKCRRELALIKFKQENNHQQPSGKLEHNYSC